MPKPEETHTRSVLKGITWRIVASLTTITISFIVTGNIVFAGVIGISDTILKFIEYFLHERVWSYIHWGYKHPPELDSLLTTTTPEKLDE